MALTNVRISRDNLTSEHIHIWEHATLLHHSFEWQASVEAFLYLSKAITSRLEGQICLLNAVIVLARLGNYNAAARILAQAVTGSELLALTFYLMGHIEFQLDNLDISKDYFGLTLRVLNDDRQSFECVGFNFELNTDRVAHNIRVLNSSIGGSNKHELSLTTALPADILFELPIQTSAYAITSGSYSRGSDGSPYFTYSVDEKAHKSLRLLRKQASKIYSNGRQDSYLHESRRRSDQRYVPSDQAPPLQQALHNLTQGLTAYQKPQSSINEQENSITPGQVQRARYLPRDARVHGESLQSLTNFIRSLPYQGNHLEPRDGRAQYEPTGELARFLRSRDPREYQATNFRRRITKSAGDGLIDSLIDDFDIQSITALENIGDTQESQGRDTWPHPQHDFEPAETNLSDLVSMKMRFQKSPDEMSRSSSPGTRRDTAASSIISEYLHDNSSMDDVCGYDNPLRIRTAQATKKPTHSTPLPSWLSGRIVNSSSSLRPNRTLISEEVQRARDETLRLLEGQERDPPAEMVLRSSPVIREYSRLNEPAAAVNLRMASQEFFSPSLNTRRYM